MTALDPDIAEAVRDVLQGAGAGVRFAYVHGSAAAGRLGPESDVDVALWADHVLSRDEWLEISVSLERRLHRPVDLLDLRRGDPIVRMQVLRKGVLVLVEDARALAEFRMYTPSVYFDTKIQRRPVEEAMLAWARTCR